MNIIINKIKVQVKSCTLIFLLLLLASCKENNNKITRFSIKPLAKFNNGDFFKINNTVICHSENYLFKKNSKDTLWIPSTKSIFEQSNSNEKKFYEIANNTLIMSVLAKRLNELKICKIIDYQSIATRDFITIKGEFKLSVDKNYSDKVIFNQ